MIGSIADNPSLTPLGDPGRLITSAEFRTPATPRESAARGKLSIDKMRMRSAIPSALRSIIVRVASGVTSRGESPVPPVVRTRSQSPESHHSLSREAIATVSSVTTSRRTTESPRFEHHSSIDRPDTSSRSPFATESEIVRIDTRIAAKGATRSCRRAASRCAREFSFHESLSPADYLQLSNRPERRRFRLVC